VHPGNFGTVIVVVAVVPRSLLRPSWLRLVTQSNIHPGSTSKLPRQKPVVERSRRRPYLSIPSLGRFSADDRFLPALRKLPYLLSKIPGVSGRQGFRLDFRDQRFEISHRSDRLRWPAV
jgi:hypothetical protein